MRTRLLLFVDFEGVLHPAGSKAKDRFQSVSLEIVNAVARRCDAGIVITSGWREKTDSRNFKGLFQGRLLGATPWSAASTTRGIDVAAFLEGFGHSIPWIAIDTHAEQFDEGALIYWVDSSLGLVERDLRPLRDMAVKAMMPKSMAPDIQPL